MLALFLAAALLGQTTGGPGVDNNFNIKEIVPKWKYEAYPANDLSTYLAALDYEAPVTLAIPTGQAKTALQCLTDDTLNDRGLNTAFKVPYDQDLVNGSVSYIDWVPNTAGTGQVRLEIQCYRANAGDVLVADPQVGVTVDAPGVVNQMVRDQLGVFPPLGIGLEGMRLCALWRDIDHPDDDYAGAACVLGIVVAYEKPVIGNEGTFTR